MNDFRSLFNKYTKLPIENMGGNIGMNTHKKFGANVCSSDILIDCKHACYITNNKLISIISRKIGHSNLRDLT